jgi:hypothetical protein
MMNPTVTSIGSSPVSNYATGVPTPLSVIRKRVVEPVVTCVNEVWTEPPTTFAPIFPDNLVIQSGDNVIELDDSPLNNRINIEHSSGTFEETHPTGVKVTKIKGTEYLIVEGNRNILVKGKSNITALASNTESLTSLNLKSLTTLTIDTDGLLMIKAGTAIIDITGMLMINAAMISLN